MGRPDKPYICWGCQNARSVDRDWPRTVTLHATVTPGESTSWHVAQCLEVDIASQGPTIAKALGNLREALELYFEDEPLPHNVTRTDLRGAAGIARVVAQWAPDLDPTERAEVQRIGARLAELADHKEVAADA